MRVCMCTHLCVCTLKGKEGPRPTNVLYNLFKKDSSVYYSITLQTNLVPIVRDLFCEMDVNIRRG